MAKKQLNPANENTSSLDIALLLSMPIVITVLIAIIWYLGDVTRVPMQCG